MTDAELPQLRLSASSLDTFKTCRRKWYFEYIEKRRGEPTIAMLVGTFAHEILENFYQLPPQERTEENAKYLARIIWNKMVENPDDEYAEFASMQLSETDQKKFRVAAWRSVKGIWALEDPQTIDVVETEREFSVEFEGSLMRGFIDRVSRTDDGIVVSDYKTGSPPGKRYQAGKLNQVYLYALMSSMLYDEPIVSAALLYLGKEILQVDIDDKKLEDTRLKLAKAVKVVTEAKANEEYPPKTQPLCGWCPHIADCPEGQEFMKTYAKRRPDAPNAILLGLAR